MKNAHGHEWAAAEAPDLNTHRTSGLLRHCMYCGSMHPDDVAEALQNGAKLEMSDWKYGWPHKVYVNNVPNPHAGMAEIRMSSSQPGEGLVEHREPRYNERTGERLADYVRYVQISKAPDFTTGKFYTEHIQDASPEAKDIIEKTIGLHIEFLPNGTVKWWPYE